MLFSLQNILIHFDDYGTLCDVLTVCPCPRQKAAIVQAVPRTASSGWTFFGRPPKWLGQAELSGSAKCPEGVAQRPGPGGSGGREGGATAAAAPAGGPVAPLCAQRRAAPHSSWRAGRPPPQCCPGLPSPASRPSGGGAPHPAYVNPAFPLLVALRPPPPVFPPWPHPYPGQHSGARVCANISVQATRMNPAIRRQKPPTSGVLGQTTVATGFRAREGRRDRCHRPTAAPLPLPPPSDTSGSDSAVRAPLTLEGGV